MKDKAQLYVMDLGYYGIIAVIAFSETEARDLMKNCHNYKEYKEADLDVYPLKPGFLFVNYGDF